MACGAKVNGVCGLAPTPMLTKTVGIPFRGMLFTGLMMTKIGPKVLEYNVRFGDPETQTVLPLLSDDTDLAQVMLAAANGHLDSANIKIQNKFSTTVVVAAGGYPGHYEKKKEITLSTVSKGLFIFNLLPLIWTLTIAIRYTNIPCGDRVIRREVVYCWRKSHCCFFYRRQPGRGCGEGVQRSGYHRISGYVLSQGYSTQVAMSLLSVE
jgi:hypothetical protein